MAKVNTVVGRDQILKNLAKTLAGIKDGTKAGVRQAAYLVARRSKIECPVDTSNLINSQYVEVYVDMAGNPVGEIGYTAFYAIYVHEQVGAVYQKPGAKAKFLEDPLIDSQKEILRIIIDNARRRK